MNPTKELLLNIVASHSCTVYNSIHQKEREHSLKIKKALPKNKDGLNDCLPYEDTKVRKIMFKHHFKFVNVSIKYKKLHLDCN